ncbi:MAG: hypothetical protein GQ574_12995 [Crocinitomix sp.]|nr:hypothetical protein [Crocinitomix sp.]
MMHRLRRFFLIVNLQTLIISVLAVSSTALCIHYKIYADFPFSLIAMSVVFPIVFSIGGAYKRREAALREYAAIKGYLRAIFFVSRDWLEKPKKENVDKMVGIIGRFFSNFRTMFMGPVEDLEKNEEKIYDNFSEFSLYIKHELREEGLSSGECSRTNQYLQKMMISFESIKHIYQYRTPRTLRSFSNLFIKILPILYGPFFAHMDSEFTFGGSNAAGFWQTYGLEYLIPVLLTMILVSLDNIQEHLENPFDQVGEDDITINVEKFVSYLDHK